MNLTLGLGLPPTGHVHAHGSEHTHDGGGTRDPLVNAVTGAPCKGKLAAAALAAIVHDPEVRAVLALRFPHLFARAESALAPFDLNKLFAVGV